MEVVEIVLVFILTFKSMVIDQKWISRSVLMNFTQ